MTFYHKFVEKHVTHSIVDSISYWYAQTQMWPVASKGTCWRQTHLRYTLISVWKYKENKRKKIFLLIICRDLELWFPSTRCHFKTMNSLLWMQNSDLRFATNMYPSMRRFTNHETWVQTICYFNHWICYQSFICMTLS